MEATSRANSAPHVFNAALTRSVLKCQLHPYDDSKFSPAPEVIAAEDCFLPTRSLDSLFELLDEYGGTIEF